MDFGSSDHKSTMRCPICGWVSITKVIDEHRYVGLSIEPTGDHFICTNPSCEVERIYCENGVYLFKKA